MHLGTKLKLYRKEKNLDQFQMADILKISHRKYQDIEKTGIILKAGDQQAIRNILGENAQNNTQGQVKNEAGVDPLSIIANLTESNRMLAEANLILANKINSNVPAGVSSSSQVKGIVSSDPTEQMQPGRTETNSDRKKQKDSAQH